VSSLAAGGGSAFVFAVVLAFVVLVVIPKRDLLLSFAFAVAFPVLTPRSKKCSISKKCHFDRSCSRLCEQRSGEIRFPTHTPPAQQRAVVFLSDLTSHTPFSR
jgi:hypothetical protein